MLPEWIQWAIPFASGAAGVYAGLKVGIAKLEANYCNLRIQVDENRAKLKEQVGQERCDRMRDECQDRIEKTLDRIESTVAHNTAHVSEELKKIAIYMAKHNGD